jgi:hypothetical protein
MEHPDDTTRLGAYSALAGALTMLMGAALWGASGADLWHALDHDAMAGYLAAASEARPLLVANLTLWILGVLLLGVAGAALVRLSRGRPAMAQIAGVCFTTGVPLAVVAFIAMLALVVRAGADPSTEGLRVAETVGWIGARADDLATALIVGFGPLFLALAGRGGWMPTWLARWGFLAGVVGLFSVLTLYVPALSGFGFAIVPAGIGWMLAAGLFLLRRVRAGRMVHDPVVASAALE